jgi:hypothetical protein
LKESTSELEMKWKNEKETITKIKQYKSAIDSMKNEAENAVSVSDLSKAAEIRYSQIPQVEKETVVTELFVPPTDMLNKSIKEFSKFKVNLQQFTNFWRAHYDFYQKLNLSYYKQVIELWYEDVMSDPYHLFSQFNIAEKTYYDESLKCPYRFDNLITNVDELRSQYFLLEKQRDKDNELY